MRTEAVRQRRGVLGIAGGAGNTGNAGLLKGFCQINRCIGKLGEHQHLFARMLPRQQRLQQVQLGILVNIPVTMLLEHLDQRFGIVLEMFGKLADEMSGLDPFEPIAAVLAVVVINNRRLFLESLQRAERLVLCSAGRPRPHP